MTDTRKQALIDLLGHVEAGEASGKFGPIMSDHWCLDKVIDAMRAYNGSLDAAKALHEAVLPGCSWGVGDTRSGVYIGGQYCSECVRESPARAWLIAILKALISECDA